MAGGTTGRMNSANFGALTTGAGTTFGAHALARRSAARRIVGLAEAVTEAERIRMILAQTIEQPARHVGDHRDFVVARLVKDDAGVAIDAGDALAIGGALRIE